MVSEFYVEAQRPLVLSAISGVWGIAALLGPMGGLSLQEGGGVGPFWVVIPILILLSGSSWYILPAVDIKGAVGEFPPCG